MSRWPEPQDDIGTLMSLLKAGVQPPRTEPHRTEVGDILVSTVETSDAGWETALAFDGEFHPVERYEDEGTAMKGHSEWVERCPGLTEVTMIGYGTIPDEKVPIRSRQP
jgi:hypothetical protein